MDVANVYGERSRANVGISRQPVRASESEPPRPLSVEFPFAINLPGIELDCCGPGEFLRQQWGERKKNPAAEAALYFPRLSMDVLATALAGQAAHRVANLAYGAGEALRGDFKRAGYRLADSILNFFGFLIDLISDIGSLLKQPFSAAVPASSRIKVCTANLSSAAYPGLTFSHFVDPFKHVGTIIDGGMAQGGYETSDPRANRALTEALDKGGLVCQNAPILSGESESLAIARLECADKFYHAGYNFMGYNCGGYTEDILKWSGLGFPLFPNVGVGSEISFGAAARHAEASRQEVVSRCDSHIKSIRNLIFALDRGKEPDEATKDYFRKYLKANPQPVPLTPDVILQIYISAARRKNAENRRWVKGSLSEFLSSGRGEKIRLEVYYDSTQGKSGNIKSDFKPLLEEMFHGMDGEALGWLKETEPIVEQLYRNLDGNPAPNVQPAPAS